jgi:hypothetical protein
MLIAINPKNSETAKNGNNNKIFLSENELKNAIKAGLEFSVLYIQKLIKISTAGNTTAVAFERHDKTNKRKEITSQKYLNLLAFLNIMYEIKPDKKKKLYKTSFLSDTQATDSTCMG